MGADRVLEPAKLKALVLRVLDENRTMALATLRPDGWPQATIVGFVHEDLTLYFVVSSQSQKLANLRRDPRGSIAVGRPAPESQPLRGLSMAARVEEVESGNEIERLNVLLSARYPGVAVFAPRTGSAALLRARPHLLSLIDEGEGILQPILLEVLTDTELATFREVH
jgi:hypothetical protein